MNRKAGVMLSYVLMLFEVMSTLLLTPFIMRTIGTAEFGVYKLSASVVAYLLLLDLGLGNAVTRFIAKFKAQGNEENNRRFLGVASLYYIIIAILSLILGVFLVKVYPAVFATGLSKDEIVLGQTLLGITMVNAAITLGTTAYANVILAYEHYSFSRICSIIQIILRIVCTVLSLRWGMGSVGLVTINLFLTICLRMIFVLYVLFRIKLIPTLKGIKFSFVQEVVVYSSWILLQMIATQINISANQIMLGILVPSATTIITVFSIGSQIVQYFQGVGSAFDGVLMPGIVKMVENKPSSRQLLDEMIRIGRYILIILSLLWGAFLLFGKQFVILWAGSDNSQAYYVALIMMSAYIFIYTESIGSQILWAMNEHKEQAIIKFIIVIISSVLSIFLIRWNPLMGATIGTFIALLIGDIVVMNYVFHKKIGIDLHKYYKGLFRGILPSTVISISFGYMIKAIGMIGWSGFLINITLVSVVYIICILSFGANESEKVQLYSFLAKYKLSKKEK